MSDRTADKAKIRAWRKAAHQGDADAQFALGRMFEQGRLVPANINAAIDWYWKATHQGHAAAEAALGDIYVRGDQVAHNFNYANKLLSSAANQGVATAMLWLSWMHAHGKGQVYDPFRTLVWARLALMHLPPSETEHREMAIAYRDWARSYLSPAQVARARRLARKWEPVSPALAAVDPAPAPPWRQRIAARLRRIARAPCHWLNAKIGAPSREAIWRDWSAWDYAQADDDDLRDNDPFRTQRADAVALLDVDRTRGFAMLVDLAERGSVPSMDRVGWCYFRGFGVAADAEKSEDWYRRAFEAGSMQGLLNYGRVLARRGDVETRERIYAAGAARDWAPASYLLAQVLVERSQTRQTFLKARPLLERAAALGSPAAKWWLVKYMIHGRFGIREIPQAFRLLWRQVLEESAEDGPVTPAATEVKAPDLEPQGDGHTSRIAAPK